MCGYSPPFSLVSETAGLQEVLWRHHSLSNLCVILFSKNTTWHAGAILGNHRLPLFFVIWVLCYPMCSSHPLYPSFSPHSYSFPHFRPEMKSKQLVVDEMYSFIQRLPANLLLFLLSNLMARKLSL